MGGFFLWTVTKIQINLLRHAVWAKLYLETVRYIFKLSTLDKLEVPFKDGWIKTTS